MATIAAKASRRAHVNTRLTELSEQLASTFDIEIPPIPGTTRDPELDQIIALERIASIFDLVLNGDAELEGEATDEPRDEVPNDRELVGNDGDVVDLEYDFAAMKRADLDEVAPQFGIDPSEYSKVDDLRFALVAVSERKGEE